MALPGTSDRGSSCKRECSTGLVASNRAGGLFGIISPLPHDHISKHHSSAAPVSVTSASVGPDIPAAKRSSTCGYVVAFYLIEVTLLFCINYRLSRPVKNPAFRVRDFAVSDFSISLYGQATLTATLEANVTVINSDPKHTVNLENIQIFVYHSDDYDWQVSHSSAEPLSLGENSNATITVRTTTEVTGSLADIIGRKLGGPRVLSFGLAIHLKEVFGHEKRLAAAADCKGLAVPFRFSGGIGFGNLTTDNPSGEVPCVTLRCNILRPTNCPTYQE